MESSSNLPNNNGGKNNHLPQLGPPLEYSRVSPAPEKGKQLLIFTSYEQFLFFCFPKSNKLDHLHIVFCMYLRSKSKKGYLNQT